MKNRYIILLLLLTYYSIAAQDLRFFNQDCYYPLTSGSRDVNGQCDSMRTKNILFSDNGAYINGIYDDGVNAGSCILISPELPGMQKAAWAVELEFKPDFDSSYRPVIVLGNLWRYIITGINPSGAYGSSINSHTINNYSTILKKDSWNKLVIIHDTVLQTTLFYLNGQLHSQIDGKLTRPSNDNKLTVSNGGTAGIFKGWWRHLKLYSRENSIATLTPTVEQISLSPNPIFRGRDIRIKAELSFSKMNLFSVTGMKYSLNPLAKNCFNPGILPPGLYLVQALSGNKVYWAKLLIE